jgi:hypothetical protein
MGETDGATQRTDLTGWVSRHGAYFGNNEDAARYHGATHRRCEAPGCDGVTDKFWLKCEKHRHESTMARFMKRKAITSAEIPDGNYLFLEDNDTWYPDIEDLLEDVPEPERIILGSPVQGRCVEPDAIIETDEELELPQSIADAINHLNKLIVQVNISNGWGLWQVQSESPRVTLE